MSLALNKTGRSIVYSCEWPFYLRPLQQVRGFFFKAYPGAESGKNREALRLQNSLPRNLPLSGLNENKAIRWGKTTFSSGALKYT